MSDEFALTFMHIPCKPPSIGTRRDAYTVFDFGPKSKRAEVGQRGAILYTVSDSCQRRLLDPYAYLRDLFTRLPTLRNSQISEVTPEPWAKAQTKPTAVSS